jgi:hypothetical protein
LGPECRASGAAGRAIWHGDQSLATDIAKVRQHKADLVDREIALHLHNTGSGAELIIRAGHFGAPKTLEVRLNEDGMRVLAGD